jgi:hypothetical protein
VWDVATRTWRGDYPPYTGYAIAFLPQTSKLWLPNQGLVEWNPANPIGQLTAAGDLPKFRPSPSNICYATSGKHCITWEGSSLSVWDLSTKPAVLLKRIDGLGHVRPTSTQDSRLAYRSERDKAVIVCEIRPSDVVERQRVPIVPNAIALSPDGNRLVTFVEYKPLRSWDLTANPPTFVEFGKAVPRGLGQMTFLPKSAHLLVGVRTAGSDFGGAEIERWDLTGPSPQRVWEKPLALPGMRYGNTHFDAKITPDGKTAAILGGSGLMQLVDISGADPKDLNSFDPAEPCFGGLLVDAKRGHLGLTRAADNCFQWWDLSGSRPHATDRVSVPVVCLHYVSYRLLTSDGDVHIADSDRL